MGRAQTSWDTHPCWSRYLGRLLALCLSLGALPGRKGGSHLAVSLRAPPNPQAGGSLVGELASVLWNMVSSLPGNLHCH